MENGIHIDVHEVEQFLLVARADGVASAVRRRECVKKRRKGALGKLHERILHGIFLGTAQHRVLNYVRHPSVVVRQRAETDGERLAVVVTIKPDKLCTVLLVFHPNHSTLDLREIRDRLYHKPADLVAYGERSVRAKRPCRYNGKRHNRHYDLLHVSLCCLNVKIPSVTPPLRALPAPRGTQSHRPWRDP